MYVLCIFYPNWAFGGQKKTFFEQKLVRVGL